MDKRNRAHWTTIAEAYLTGFMNASTSLRSVQISRARKSKLILYLQEQGYNILPEEMDTPAMRRTKEWDADEGTILDFIRDWWKEKTGNNI